MTLAIVCPIHDDSMMLALRHRRLVALSSLALSGLAAGLVRCSTDEFSGTDAGTDAPVGVDVTVDSPVDTGPGDVRLDTGGDAIVDSGPPAKCDKLKAFGAPTKLTVAAKDVTVDAFGSFRIDPSETHAWFSQGNQIRQYDVTGTTLTVDGTIAAIASQRGFGVSANGLELVYTTPPANVVRYTRANLASAWSNFIVVDVPMAVPDGAAYQGYYHPSHLGNGPTFYFGRFVFYSSQPSEWDIVRATQTDAASYAPVIQGGLHASNFAFVFEPALADDLTMYFARWSDGITDYPRLARSTRANAQSPWSAPTPVPMPPLPFGPNDTLKPYAVTPDECALYFGYNQSVDGSVSTSGPFTVYVARRPL